MNSSRVGQSNGIDKGICILGFDSGGPGTYAQLLIVKQYMRGVAIEIGVDESHLHPADYFDLMGGVGFGGLVAILLGRLRMTVDEAMTSLLAIANAVFSEGPDTKRNPELNMVNLKSAIEEMLVARGIHPGVRMYDKALPHPKCKVVLYAATSANITHPHIFRTYSRASLNPTIVEALCATMASPAFFSSLKIGPPMREQEFVGGALGANNPTRELLKEAGNIFGDDERVAQIISVGAGKPGPISLESIDPKQVASKAIESLLADCESVAADLSTRLLNVDAYVRLNADITAEHYSIDNWGELAAIESKTNAYLQKLSVARVLEVSLQYLQTKVGTATLGHINNSSSVNLGVKMAPALSPHYVVRQKEWANVVHHLVDVDSTTQKVFCITGMGGCGKTQLVSYFLQEKGPRYKHVIFVDASSASSLKSDLQAWAQSLGTGREQDVWEDALRVLASDAYRGTWILILDNADNPQLSLNPFLPRCYHGTIIITSRNRDAGDLANTFHLELGEMRQDEAISTLFKSARRQPSQRSEEIESASTLARLLGYLAVALVQAGTYCAQVSSSGKLFTFAEYITLFVSQRAELMKKAQPLPLDNYQLGAYTALDISYKALPPLGQDFIHLASSFHYTNMSLAIYATASTYAFADAVTLLPRSLDHEEVISKLKTLLCVQGKWNEVAVHEIIHILRSFSLLSASSVANTVFLHLHPLVHTWARDMLPSSFSKYKKMALQVLTSCIGDVNFHIYRHILPHIQNLLDVISSTTTHINDQFAAAVVFKEQGYIELAEGLFTHILGLLRQIKGQEAKEAAIVVSRQVLTTTSPGKWNDADEVAFAVVEQRRRELGPDHPDTLLAVENLIATYSSHPSFNEVEKLEVELLEQQKRLMGKDHPDTILAAANLAATYKNQFRYEEAEELMQEVLEQRARLLGDDHPNTMRAATSLAAVYNYQGRYDEAEKLYSRVLEKRRTLMGNEDPYTILAAGNLATTYKYQDRYDEAEVLELEVLRVQRDILGKEHSDTIMATRYLAMEYASQEKWQKAVDLLIEGLTVGTHVLAKEYPWTKMAVADLTHALKQLGRSEEAQEFESLLV